MNNIFKDKTYCYERTTTRITWIGDTRKNNNYFKIQRIIIYSLVIES
jgi:hypothetical protein